MAQRPESKSSAGEPVISSPASLSAPNQWLSQRRAALARLSFESFIAWIGLLYYLSARTPQTPQSAVIFYSLVPLLTTLTLLYWRGWNPARYLAVVVNTLVMQHFSNCRQIASTTCRRGWFFRVQRPSSWLAPVGSSEAGWPRSLSSLQEAWYPAPTWA